MSGWHFSGLFSSKLANLALALVVAGLLIAAVAWLSRRESSAVSPSARRWLLSVRSLVILALVVTLCLDPSTTRTTTESVAGTVLIAVDTSGSMALNEPHRPVVDKFHLAERLNLTDVPSGTLKLWESIAASGAKPKFAGPNDPDIKAFDQTLAVVDGLTRFAANQKLLAHGDWLSRLKAVHRVEIMPFDRQRRTEATLQKTASTDLNLPFSRAAELGPGCVGMILMTDGRATVGETPGTPNINAPVHALTASTRTSPVDLSIRSAKPTSNTAFKGSIVPVEVSILAKGWPNDLLRVTVTPQGGKPAEIAVGHPGGDAEHRVTVLVPTQTVGVVPLDVKVTAAAAIDAYPQNNQRSPTVTIVTDKARVLLIDAEPRWEFHYLHTALGRDPAIDLRSVALRQPRLGTTSDKDLKAQGMPATQLPDADTLSAYDLVILGDLAPSDLSSAWANRLERFVADSGGTLAIVPGKQSMPFESGDGPIRRMLPITKPEAVQSDNGMSLELTSPSAAIMSLAETPDLNREVWSRFPPHFWAVTGTPKPGATVLATLTKDGKAHPVIVSQPYGFGKVVGLGIDSTWRWRFKVGDVHHHRFWRQLAQWAASDRLLPAVNAAGTIRFGTSEPILEADRETKLIVRTTEEAKTVTGPLRATIIRLADPESVVRTVSVEPVPEKPREWSTPIVGLPQGRYAIELNVPEWATDLDDGRGPLRAMLTVTEPDAIEFTDVSPDWAWLDAVTKANQGKVHTVDTLDELVDSLTERTATREVTLTHRLRHSWWLLGFVVGLLTIEWTVRKWYGLA